MPINSVPFFTACCSVLARAMTIGLIEFAALRGVPLASQLYPYQSSEFNSELRVGQSTDAVRC
eukprot:5789107-Amphidinium_carterae.1